MRMRSLLLSALALPLCLFLAFSIMSPELKASASDYQSQTTLSDSMTLSILGTGGNNISAYYLASDNTYKSCTLTPINTNLTFGSSNAD